MSNRERRAGESLLLDGLDEYRERLAEDLVLAFKLGVRKTSQRWSFNIQRFLCSLIAVIADLSGRVKQRGRNWSSTDGTPPAVT